ncbi:unnamed protein product [Cuscuta campestris]|uniref:Uncharacterized protein n=1 Tax=Cuscuta campestris TaxID=132261 RepID=A0A484KKP1_9ASTE|nr:unnamed protein product [Cuscuta campestris]
MPSFFSFTDWKEDIQPCYDAERCCWVLPVLVATTEDGSPEQRSERWPVLGSGNQVYSIRLKAGLQLKIIGQRPKEDADHLRGCRRWRRSWSYYAVAGARLVRLLPKSGTPRPQIQVVSPRS